MRIRRSSIPVLGRPRLLALSLVGLVILLLAALPGLAFAGQVQPAEFVPEGESSIGDFVWYDTDLDGLQDLGELGIDGVLVVLYIDDGDGIFDPAPGGGDTLVAQMLTGDNPATPTVEQGWYDFRVTITNQLYWVHIDPSNFVPSGPLEDHILTSENTYGPNPMPVFLPPGIQDYNDADFGYVLSGITVEKTVYRGHNGGASCPGGELVTDVVGAAVTYCFVVTNTGDTYIQPVTITDPALGIPPNTVVLASGTFPLAPNAQAVFYFETMIARNLVNTAEACGTPTDDQGVPIPGSSDECDSDTAEVRVPAAIGNYVWVDENGNGYQDADEPGLPNVRVVLYDSAGNVVDSTVTDAHGGYLFDNVPPGNYFVRVDGTTLPAGMSQTAIYPNPGSDFYNQDQSTGPNDYGYPVTVGAGDENLTADFGYNYPGGAIGDHVWNDADGDGVQDPEEAGIPGVCMELFGPGPDGIFNPGADGIYGTGDDDSTVLATTSTNASGYYVFSGLAAGGYVVQACQSNFTAGGPLSGYTQTGDPDHFGLPGGVNDNMTTTPVILAPGDVFVNADFGYQLPANQCGDIGDLVWLDTNGNGAATPDPGEYGIPGVTVALIRDLNGNGVWEAGEPVIATDTTDASGNYLFRCLPTADGQGTDDYLVWVNDTNNVLAGLTPTYDNNGIATANVSAATNLAPAGNLVQDFSYTPAGQEPGEGVIGDTIWLNVNGNNVQEPGEPGVEGVQVNLYGPGPNGVCGGGDDVLVATTTTDENGHYYFGGLPTSAGGETYCVVVDPSNFNPGGPLAGLSNTYDPDGAPLNQSQITLTNANPVNLLQDFGYTPPQGQNGTIGDLVWNDVNADGNVDVGENGIAGVTIDLIRDLNENGLVDPGEPVIATTVTGAGGAYLFSGLPTSDGTADGDVDYVVNVTDVNGVLAGAWHSLGTPNTNNNSQVEPYAVALTVAQPNDLTADFGYYVLPAALGNKVWFDTNGNGLQDVGEPGLANVRVKLTITYPDSTVTTIETLTDNTGYYVFGNLLLDEDFNGVGANEPVFVISVTNPPLMVPTIIDVNANGNDNQDADNPAGVTATTTQGQNDVSPQTPVTAEPPNAWYDFGYIVTDYGDLPDTGPGSGVGNYQTLIGDNGPDHLVWDTTPTDGVPNLGGAVWMGAVVDAEPDGQPNAGATGDDINGTPDDEDGIGSTWAWPAGGVGSIIVEVNKLDTNGNPLPSGTLTGAVLVSWIDWNNNGTFTDPGEINIWGDIPSEPLFVGTNTVGVAVPPNFTTPLTLYMRFRLYSGPQASYSPTGAMVNGEVEDYQQPVRPLAVVLEDFYVEVQNNQVRVVWVTVSEINNLGFNLYRGTSRNPDEAVRVNDTLIPSAAPGSASGHEYEWVDPTAAPGQMYFYWLEDTDTFGISTRHGPVSVIFGMARLGFLPWMRK